MTWNQKNVEIGIIFHEKYILILRKSVGLALTFIHTIQNSTLTHCQSIQIIVIKKLCVNGQSVVVYLISPKCQEDRADR